MMNDRISPQEETASLIGIAEFSSLAEAEEYALVVVAMGLECWILKSPPADHFAIFADPAHAEAIRGEFRAYASELAEATREIPEPRVFDQGLELALLWVITLFVVFHFQVQDHGVTDRFCSSSTDLIDRGQWWRPFTALFLHADFPHLLGNVILGLIFCLLVAHSMGPWLGWTLILGSGTLANAMNAWLRYPDSFQALGASTATFGALGILVGFGSVIAWQSRSYRKLGGILVPLGAGICLLGWFGKGEPPTDALGHLLGFLAGGVAGVITAAFRVRKGAA